MTATADMLGIVVPLVFLLGIGVLLTASESAKVRWVAPVNLGVMFGVVVVLYGAYPLVIYLVLGGTYTPLNDSRLFQAQPAPEVVGRIAWYHVLYLTSFVVSYWVASAKSSSGRAMGPRGVDSPQIWALMLVFVVLRLTTLIADVALAEPSIDYVDSYLRYRHLPLILQQVLGHANGILSVLGIAIVCVTCTNWARYRWLVIALISIEALGFAGGIGSRANLALLVLALLVSYHHQVRNVAFVRMLAIGLALLTGFLALGFLRAYQQGGLFVAAAEALTSATEFEALFANAIDLDRLTATGQLDRDSIWVAVYLGDIIGLVPQQLMPIEKVNLARWYLETYYMSLAEAGAGRAFGAIAESIVGTGPLDLTWRGAIVGTLFGIVDRRMRTREVGLWAWVLYVWAIVTCYLAFRSSTLAQLPHLVYRYVPAALVVTWIAGLLRPAALEGPHSANREAVYK